MNKFERQLNDAASTIRLSRAEKDAMKDRLVTLIEYKPVRGGLNNENAQARTSKLASGWYVSASRVLRVRYVPAMLILGLVFAGGGGVSLAANGALPGELLYPVKVKVNEEVRAALARTDETKTAWAIERAQRRLEEAEALVTAGKFDEPAHVAVSSSFRAHMDTISANLDRLGEEEFATIELSARLEGALDAHAEILAALSTDDARSTTRLFAEEVGEGRQLLAQRTSSDIGSAAVLRLATGTVGGETEDAARGASDGADVSFSATSFAPEVDTLATPPSDDANTSAARAKREDGSDDVDRERERALAERVRSAAEQRIENAWDVLVRLETSGEISEHSALRARTELENAATLLADGARFLEEGSYDAARTSYRSALFQAERTNVLLRAGARLREIGVVDMPAERPASDAPVSSRDGDGDRGDDAPATQSITVGHAFREGTHVYRGVATVPTPCHELSVSARVAESFPEQIHLSLTTSSTADVCIQVLAEQEFSIKVVASEHATVTASLNGERVDVVLIEEGRSGEGSTPAPTSFEAVDAEESRERRQILPSVRLPF